MSLHFNFHKNFLLLCLFWLVGSSTFAQSPPTLKEIENMDGQNKVNAIIELVTFNERDFMYEEPEKTLELLSEALKLSEKYNYNKGIEDSHYELRNYYEIEGDFVGELEHLLQVLDHFKSTGNMKDVAETSILIGNVYKDHGNLPDALQYYIEAKPIFEQLNDKNGEATVLGSIGLIYINEEKYSSAVEYFQNALDLLKQAPEKEVDKQGLAVTYTNLGRAQSNLGNYAKALDYFNRAVEIDKKQDTPEGRIGVAYDYFAIAEVMEKQGSYHSALNYIEDAVSILQEEGDTYAVTACRILEGKIYRKLKLYDNAIEQLHAALENAKNLESKPFTKQAYEQISILYEEMDNLPKAFEYYKQFIAVKDSITSSEISDSIEKLRNSYEVREKNKENARLRKENEKERYKNNLLVALSIFGGLLSLLFIVLMYNRYKIKQKANQELEAQTQIIEQSNEKIMGSIRYGRRIQNALLDSGEQINQVFPESFVFLKPKDIVSGDFYWYVNRGNEQIIAAIDCTGHGVPGAFMTVFGYSLLNRIVNNDGVTEPSQILAMLGLEVMKLFQTKEEDQIIRDGMDMALVKIDRDNKVLQFAGAGRPLVLHTKDGQQYVKGDRVGLGGKQLVERGQPFKTFEHKYEEGDTFYVFSDGYQDQFGGPEGRKFMSKNFRRLLEEIQPLNMAQQEAKLEERLQEWMGEEKQTDDMIVIGVRIT